MAQNTMMLSTQLMHEREPLIDSQSLPDCVQDADDDQDGLGIRCSPTTAPARPSHWLLSSSPLSDSRWIRPMTIY